MKLIAGISAVFLFAVLAVCQTPIPSFKGHQIGETPEEFFGKEPKLLPLSENPTVADCLSSRGDRSTRKQIAKKLKSDQGVVERQCDLIIRIKNGDHAYIAPAVFNIVNTGEFDAGMLVSLDIFIPLIGTTFERTANDVAEKLGSQPVHQGVSAYQNRFGAKYDFPWARWESGGLVVSLKQTEVRDAKLNIADAEWIKKQAEVKRPNSLD